MTRFMKLSDEPIISYSDLKTLFELWGPNTQWVIYGYFVYSFCSGMCKIKFMCTLLS